MSWNMHIYNVINMGILLQVIYNVACCELDVSMSEALTFVKSMSVLCDEGISQNGQCIADGANTTKICKKVSLEESVFNRPTM